MIEGRSVGHRFCCLDFLVMKDAFVDIPIVDVDISFMYNSVFFSSAALFAMSLLCGDLSFRHRLRDGGDWSDLHKREI